MRGQKDLCLFCRNNIKSRISANRTRSFASSRNGEPYVLPRLVIDLDAADNKLVKKAEDLYEETTQSPHQRHGSEIRALKINRVPSINMGKEEQRWKQGKVKSPRVGFRTLTVTAPDLMSYALFGDPNNQSGGKQSRLKKLFISKGIHPSDNAETKIQQLLLDFTTDPFDNLKRAGFVPSHERGIADKIEVSSDFPSLHRMVTMLSSTKEGCEFLAINGAKLVEGIRSCRSAQGRPLDSAPKVSASMVLALLNNLHLAMESNGVEFGEDLCNAGLYYAAKSQVIPAVKLYLELAVKHVYATDWRTKMALRLLHRQYLLSQRSDSDNRATAEGLELHRKETMQLITGWTNGLLPENREQRKPSFALLCEQDSEKSFEDSLYPRHIIGLGEMGHSDELWSEWNSMRVPCLSRTIRGEQHVQFRAIMFAMAFILAGNSRRALTVLESVPASEEATFHGNEYQQSAKRWKFPTEVDLSYVLLMINDHYWMHSLKPSETLCTHVKQQLQNIPDRATEVLSLLESLLVKDYLNFQGGEKIPKREITWSEEEGNEGLLVLPVRGSRPIYFKASKRSG